MYYPTILFAFDILVCIMAVLEKKLRITRHLLGEPSQLPITTKLKLLDLLKKILQTDQDPRLCRVCHKGLMPAVRQFRPLSNSHAIILSFVGSFVR